MLAFFINVHVIFKSGPLKYMLTSRFFPNAPLHYYKSNFTATTFFQQYNTMCEIVLNV